MKKFQRALQIWSLLVCAARDRRTYTYGELASILGVGARGMAQFLDPIMRYCRKKSLPPLTVLVVGKGTGRPGAGLNVKKDVDQERERVFDYDWFKMEPPEIRDFEEAARA